MPPKRSKPDLPTKQINVRLPIPLWARLGLAASVLGITRSRLVTEALTAYVAGLPAALRRLIDDAAAARKG